MSDFKSSDRIRRAKHEKNYTVILNSTIQDSRLSWKSRGLHHYILSLPDDWSICIAHLTEQSLPDGEATVKSALKELETLGYLSKVRLKDDRGRFSKCVWDIYETPQVDFQLVDKRTKRKSSKTSPQVDYPQVDKPQVDKPQVDKPQVDKPQVENHRLISTYIQSTKNQQSTYVQSRAHENFGNQDRNDRISKMQQAERDKWTQSEIDCKALSKDKEFQDYIKTVYLPSVPEYRGKEIEIALAMTWIVKGQRDPARRDLVEIQLEAFEIWRSRQQKTKSVAQKDERPRLRKPNPLTWTAEQENWTYEQWEKFLNEQNSGNATIYAAN
jgi:hypothetical protein